MKEVRVVVVHDSYTDYDEVSNSIMREGVTDWEQVSDEELKLLRQNWWRFSQEAARGDNTRLVLLEKDAVPAQKRIGSIRQWLKEEKDREDREEAARRVQAEERLRKKLMKTAESERKLLEKLREKYPDA
jgi:hypothetical protein